MVIHFFVSADDKLCCDDEMVTIMKEGFNMASALFGRCSTCMKNFRKLVCAFNCSPEQSRFLIAHNNTKPNDGNHILLKFTMI